MDPSNDNRPAAEASRLLPILGQVAPDRRVILAAARAPDGEGAADRGHPNDPREA
ncbi:MAG: hypothetical protein JWQ52_606 [Phenylobacterium sp.]|nr:hypothetical protein [Phenylobacterium sp.]